MRISIFGLGYVGSVCCGCLAKLGHDVIGVDIQPRKVDPISRGESPIIEPGLDELIAAAAADGKLRATTDPDEAVRESDVAFICVGTPSNASGGVDPSSLLHVAGQIGDAVRAQGRERYTVVVRSTALPPVTRDVRDRLAGHAGRAVGDGLGFVYHPEFLREGCAVADFFNPPKIVFGVDDEASAAVCRDLYPGVEAPTAFVPLDVASMVKYADNCYHALKVTFGNEIGTICRAFDVDALAVMDLFCRDEKLNISARYLRPGGAFGGSCLPKDLRAVLDAARQLAVTVPMLQGTLASNETQIAAVLQRVLDAKWQTIGLVGLAFKEGTDDVRESPMVTVVKRLSGEGRTVRIYDVHLSVPSLVGANRAFALESIPYLEDLMCESLQALVDEADGLIVTHRLDDETWNGLRWKEGLPVLDLVDVAALRGREGYEGLYW